MLKFIKKINKLFANRTRKTICLVLILIIGSLFCLKPAYALGLIDILNLMGQGLAFVVWWVVATLLQALAGFIGQTFVTLTAILVWVVKWDSFINSPPVDLGWGLVRDFCNLFFILLILAIAIGTILRIETYNLKRWLPKLVAMAILINFSKLICGIIIDFAQVIMLTFAYHSVGATAGNIYLKFGIGKLTKIDKSLFGKAGTSYTESNVVTIWSLMTSLFLAVTLLLIAFFVLLVYILIFALRIIGLWVLIVLSPLAYLLAAFPQGAQYSAQWWRTFIKYAFAGPVLMFFFWLAMSVSDQTFSKQLQGSNILGQEVVSETGKGSELEKTVRGAITEAGSVGNMFKFLMTTCFLLGGIIAAQQVGTAGMGFAGRVMGGLRSAGGKVAALPFKGAKAYGGFVVEKVNAWTGLELQPSKWKAGWEAGRQRHREARETQMRAKAAKRGGFLGALATPEHAVDQYWGLAGFRRVWREGIGAGRFKKLQGERDKLERLNVEAQKKKEAIGIDVEAARKRMSEVGSLHAILGNVFTPGAKIDIASFPWLRERIESQISTSREESKQLVAMGKFSEADELAKEAAELEKQSKAGKFELKPSFSFSDQWKQDISEHRRRMEAEIKDIQAAIKITELKPTEKDRIVKEADRLAEELKKKEEKVAWVRPAVNYAMRREQRLAIQKEKADMTTDSWQELVSIFEDAQKKGDLSRAAAAYIKATEYANENEFHNWFDYRSDAKGMRDFIENELIKKMGMSEEQGLALANDVSYAAEKVNHWAMARAVVVKDGRQVWQDEEGRFREIMAEVRKKDFEGFMRNANRLAFGYEVPAADFRKTGNREFYMNPFGLSYIIENFDKFGSLLERGRFNINLAINLGSEDSLRQLAKFAKPGLMKYDKKQEKDIIFTEVLDDLEKFAGPEVAKNPFADIEKIIKEQMAAGRV